MCVRTCLSCSHIIAWFLVVIFLIDGKNDINVTCCNNNAFCKRTNDSLKQSLWDVLFLTISFLSLPPYVKFLHKYEVVDNYYRWDINKPMCFAENWSSTSMFKFSAKRNEPIILMTNKNLWIYAMQNMIPHKQSNKNNLRLLFGKWYGHKTCWLNLLE